MKSFVFRPAGIIVVASLSLSGCQTVQDNKDSITGGLIGGLTASAACMLAKGSPVLCAAVGVAGALVGGVIGHHLDERDKARRQAALQQTLDNQKLWSQANAASTPAPATSPPQLASTSPDAPAPTKKSKVKSVVAPTPLPPPEPSNVTWKNPDTNDSGTFTPLRSYAAPSTGQECREYQEDYVREGQTYSQKTQACKKPDGTWEFKDL